jgi:hypothetical protein
MMFALSLNSLDAKHEIDFATSNPCAAGAPPRMKKCYTTQQERSLQRSMIRSCCEPGHQYDPDASQAPPSVAPIWEARREEFDPSLASRYLVRQSGSPYPMEELLPPASFL